ncbi:hypothetical protein CRH15_11990 [Lelliottia amnigena]|nr:hypothetical protein CO697_10220 [Lelliottia amnigena]PEG64560.1 hypothetical protein CRH15_11990 [Lelliottia amnigena]
MLHVVTGARSVGSVVTLRNQTSGESIGLTRWNVASLFIKFFKDVYRNGICVAKMRPVALIEKGDFCVRSFFSVISLTYRLLRH